MSERDPDAPPAGLSAAAQARWREVWPRLAGKTVDRDTLRTYCQLWVRWREAEDTIATTGQLTRTGKGRVVASPLIAIASQAGGQVRALESRLGLKTVEDAPPSVAPGGLLTRRELAALLDINMMTVTKWERDGLPIAEIGRKGKPSKYLEGDVRAWLDAREKEADRGDVSSVAKAKARQATAQAELAEQAYLARAGRLLPAEEVERVWSAEVEAVRSAILATYTTQADTVHRAAVLDGVAGVEKELKRMAYDLLRQLSRKKSSTPAHGTAA